MASYPRSSLVAACTSSPPVTCNHTYQETRHTHTVLSIAHHQDRILEYGDSGNIAYWGHLDHGGRRGYGGGYGGHGDGQNYYGGNDQGYGGGLVAGRVSRGGRGGRGGHG
uniref:Uncharacterized protein n=1 Tax=Setaria viridis TaxID=4556 RepID=A0A4U6TDU3_SETVI|nr:hypothetical protein SEVIR_8G100400v2 [Setaria viridis]